MASAARSAKLAYPAWSASACNRRDLPRRETSNPLAGVKNSLSEYIRGASSRPWSRRARRAGASNTTVLPCKDRTAVMVAPSTVTSPVWVKNVTVRDPPRRRAPVTDRDNSLRSGRVRVRVLTSVRVRASKEGRSNRVAKEETSVTCTAALTLVPSAGRPTSWPSTTVMSALAVLTACPALSTIKLPWMWLSLLISTANKVVVNRATTSSRATKTTRARKRFIWYNCRVFLAFWVREAITSLMVKWPSPSVSIVSSSRSWSGPSPLRSNVKRLLLLTSTNEYPVRGLTFGGLVSSARWTVVGRAGRGSWRHGGSVLCKSTS
mmetsp:Transcript_57115/g.131519  ORF Transcript_57115/g.131519 Transcript_57115/m.131519 type:complete len:321 (-) Transcript_57115:141-1103(-)